SLSWAADCGPSVSWVAVRGDGDRHFRGTGAPRIGQYDSGRGLTLQVTFADGQRRLDHWDGRDAVRTFRYRSASPAVTAVLDPERILLLDTNQTNNSAAIAAPSAQPVEGAARFLVWISDALLTCAGVRG